MSARLTIDLRAFRHNVVQLAQMVSPAQTMLAIKANAYGLALLPIARSALAAGAGALAVLEIPAALTLRESGITKPLFAWLHGQGSDFHSAIELGVDLGVSSRLELTRIARAVVKKPARVHLKIDTGLHRNGASAQQWPELITEALSFSESGLVEIAGLWSHLADTSPEDDRQALAAFRKALRVAAQIGVPMRGEGRPLLHLAASSAGIRMPEARFDLVRFGIAAYGVSPFSDLRGANLGLLSTVRLEAEVVHVSREQVYLDVGTVDGIPPVTQDSGAEVLLGERRVRVLAVQPDTTVLENYGGARVGETAVVYGGEGEPSVEDWASWSGTIGDEILVHTSRRIPRIFVD